MQLDKWIESEKPVYAVDTNIVIIMYKIFCGKIDWTSKMAHKEECKQIVELLNLARNGKIDLLIPLGVLAELNFRTPAYKENIINFAKSGLFLRPNLKKSKTQEYAKTIEKIAMFYTHNFSEKKPFQTDEKDKDINYDLMKSVFYKNEKGKPYNDAYIMAEAALLKLPLITIDFKDFLFEQNPQIIAYKNSLMNLPVYAKPIKPKAVCAQFKSHSYTIANLQDEDCFTEFFR